MKIQFLGYGGAFDWPLSNSAAIVTHKDYRILIDCGHTTYGDLREYDLVDGLTHVLITHLHADHCGSLGTLLAHRKLAPGSKPLTIIYPDKNFKQAMKSLVEAMLLNSDEMLFWESIETFSWITAIDTHGLHVPEKSSYGYIFRDGGTSIVYSGDLKDIDFLIKKVEKEQLEDPMIFMDVAFKEYAAHAYYKDVERYLDRFTIVGYHNDPASKPEDCKVPIVADFDKLLFS